MSFVGSANCNPTVDTNIKYTIIPNIIFTAAPATTIAILFQTLAFEKEPSESEASYSPSILQNPPRGIIRSEYFVSFPCFCQITFPNPIANSFTLTLQSLATIQWPPS